MNATAAIHFRADAGRGANESFYRLAARNVESMRCSGTACFVARHGMEDSDRAFGETEWPRLYCRGCCYAAPVDGGCLARPNVECPAPESIVLARVLKGGARSIDEYRAFGGYRGLTEAMRHGGEDLIEKIGDAGLRGRGGAGFPTALKWWSAAAHSEAEKFVIANGDEGDAGAYIDRILMEDDPFAVLEGLTLAAYAIGAQRGWVYIRAEYPHAIEAMQAAVEDAKAAGFLGETILGTDFSFNVEIAVGNGSYLCGEETAQIRSIEKLRPEAQIKPPFASERGLFGKPTVMNNIETLVNIPWIGLHGGPAFARYGFSKSRGTKVISLSSLFRRPGLYEVEFGISVRDIVEELGGGLRDGRIKGLMIGGPLTGVIPPNLFDTSFGFEELRAIGASVGHGGVIAFDDRTSIVQLVRHIFSFGAYESCGKCTPCRLGSRRIENIFRDIAAVGHTAANRDQEWREIVTTMKRASLCGHGTGLADFANSILRYYKEDLAPCFV